MGSGPRIVVVLSLVVLSLLAATTGATAVAGDRSPAAAAVGDIQPQTATGSEVTQTFIIVLQRDGDARWTVTKTFELTTENETAAFESVAESFEAGETSDLGLASYQRASQLASESTGRDMRITNVSRSATRTRAQPNGTGRLSVSFTWTNFGRLSGDTFYIDDVFSTEYGPWFDDLYASQRLIVRPPDGYRFFDAPIPVTLRNGTIQWTGPQEFSPGTLSATFERTGDGEPTATPTPPTPQPTAESTTQTTGGTPAGNESGSLLWAGVVTLGLGAVVVGYLLVRDRNLLDTPGGGKGGTERPTSGPDSGPTAPTPPAGDVPVATTDESDDAQIDVELLSDEERVERLLERNGGRMKQANIVKETDWSNAKVSQLLSSMEEDGQIDKLRIGRENLISFPDEDITDFEE